MNPARPFVAHRQLYQHVAGKVRADILEGRCKPGEWLRQERLARELGVSRMPVREAAQRHILAARDALLAALRQGGMNSGTKVVSPGSRRKRPGPSGGVGQGSREAPTREE